MSYKTIMVHLELGRSNAGLLAICATLARRFQANVIGIAGCQPVRLYDEAYLVPEVFAEDRETIEKQMNATEEQFRTLLAGAAKEIEWRSTVTYLSLADYIAHQARAADLIITGPDISGTLFDSTRRVAIADLVMQAGRPVLVVPHGRDKLDLDHVVVAWKGTRECRRAVADALPLLKLASRVTVVEIAPDAEISRAKGHLADVQKWLGGHGVTAKSQAAVAIGPDSERLAEILREKKSDLVVAGAYGHSRVREWVLGGVTGDFLLNPDRCVHISH